MKIIRATHLGMCFGVRDAIALALRQPEPLTIFGDLVHNETVLKHLRTQGVQIKHQVAEISTETVMVTAHGAAQRAIERLQERGLRVIEATCPLVRFAHRSVLGLARAGYHPVVVGRRDHVEVRGLTGDLDEYDVVLDEADVDRLPERARYGVVSQTTQPLEKVRRLVERLRGRFPQAEVRWIDTVCLPTKQRQRAALELARQCDAVVVVGGAASNNTRELVASCETACARVHHVQTAEELRSIWFEGAESVGVTAGTSTPDAVIDEVEGWLREFAEFQQQLEHKREADCCVTAR